MKLEAKKLLFDVITACHDIEEFITAGKAFDNYLENELLRPDLLKNLLLTRKRRPARTAADWRIEVATF